MSQQVTESCVVKGVNTHEGYWDQTVDKTMIPSKCKSMNSISKCHPFLPSPAKTTINKLYRNIQIQLGEIRRIIDKGFPSLMKEKAGLKMGVGGREYKRKRGMMTGR